MSCLLHRQGHAKDDGKKIEGKNMGLKSSVPIFLPQIVAAPGFLRIQLPA
jgi:hypothetical protein